MERLCLYCQTLNVGRPGQKSGAWSVKPGWWQPCHVTSAALTSSVSPIAAAKTAPGHWLRCIAACFLNPIPHLIFFARECCGLLRQSCASKLQATGAQNERYSLDTIITGEKSRGFWLGWSNSANTTGKWWYLWGEKPKTRLKMTAMWGKFLSRPNFQKKCSIFDFPNIRFRGFC